MNVYVYVVHSVVANYELIVILYEQHFYSYFNILNIVFIQGGLIYTPNLKMDGISVNFL